MTRTRRSFRAALASPLAAVLLTLSVVVPVMDRADFAHAPVVESEHQPGSCPTPHDHTVCTQVGANHAAPGAGEAGQSLRAVQRVGVVFEVRASRDTRAHRSTSARAPPRG
jgi:hypothetical protein